MMLRLRARCMHKAPIRLAPRHKTTRNEYDLDAVVNKTIPGKRVKKPMTHKQKIFCLVCLVLLALLMCLFALTVLAITNPSLAQPPTRTFAQIVGSVSIAGSFTKIAAPDKEG